METLIKIYHDLFPGVELRDWFYALLGIMLHLVIKMKNIAYRRFRFKILLDEFIPVWFFSITTVIICMGVLPQVLTDFSAMDASLIGYSSSSVFKQLLKNRLSRLGLKNTD